MGNPAIRVSDLGKRYAASREGAPLYRALREELMGVPGRLWRRWRRAGGAGEFWALRGVDLEVGTGEVLGVIGRNGAGKSTLLKILSRIVEPTEGEVELWGRLGSLLEVGTGFHPELTGRENIFLSGALLGMRRDEVRARFDEIVAFAEVEAALERPVKHYSSGMHARLGFAVAAHLRTEILLLDEVLAVGDAEFQRRCLGKMGEVAGEGRTVVFVSHNLSAVRQMCARALWLSDGRVREHGEVGDVVAAYLRAGEVSASRNAGADAGRDVWFEEARLVDAAGMPAGEFCVGDDVGIEFRLRVAPAKQGRPIKLAVALATSDGLSLAHMIDVDSDFSLGAARADQWVRVTMRDQRFYPGGYQLSLWAGTPDSQLTYAEWPDALRFVVVGGGGRTARTLPRSSGVVFLTPGWDVRP